MDIDYDYDYVRAWEMEVKQFDERFENFLKASGITNKRICWTCIHRFIDNNWYVNNLFRTRSGDGVIKFCLDILMEHDCINKFYLYTFLEFYFRWHFEHCTCEDGHGTEIEYIHDVMRPLKVLESKHENQPLSKVSFDSLPSCVTDVKFMMILFKYGIHTESSVFNFTTARDSLKRFLQHTIDDEELSDIQDKQGYLTDIATRIVELLVHNSDELWCGGERRGNRYIYLLIRIVHAITLGLEESPSILNFIECSRMFYMTISDPYVCKIDMHNFLHILYTMPLHRRKVSFNEIATIYRRFFINELPTFYEPRSLKDLCRVSVRNYLRNNKKMLPQSVRSLHIPRSLHDYLLCTESSSKNFTCGYEP